VVERAVRCEPNLASAGWAGARFLSSAAQFVSNVMDVGLGWSAVWTTNCLASEPDVVADADDVGEIERVSNFCSFW
jgi:hypothetical protein